MIKTGALPGQVCLVNVTNIVSKYPRVHKGLFAAPSLFGSLNNSVIWFLNFRSYGKNIRSYGFYLFGCPVSVYRPCLS